MTFTSDLLLGHDFFMQVVLIQVWLHHETERLHVLLQTPGNWETLPRQMIFLIIFCRLLNLKLHSAQHLQLFPVLNRTSSLLPPTQKSFPCLSIHISVFLFLTMLYKKAKNFISMSRLVLYLFIYLWLIFFILRNTGKKITLARGVLKLLLVVTSSIL